MLRILDLICREMKKEFSVIGLMSGTSLDGLDVVYCVFDKENKWTFTVMQGKTFGYDTNWKKRLSSADQLSGLELALLHVELGQYHGTCVKSFIDEFSVQADFVGSHGHTIFHQPEKSLTLQIGSAPHIAAQCGLPVVADFRTLDVALGGQGAPLVPIGDKLLFGEYDGCLNLGGIANISFQGKNENIETQAFDICTCNMALNALAQLANKEYDDGGKMARAGVVDENLLNELNSFSFYKLPSPKSLGKEFYDEHMVPVLSKYAISVEDKMRTIVEHIAIQIAEVLNQQKEGKVLVTGGGAHNDFLLEKMRGKTSHTLVKPDSATIDFKEAIIFAFLGLLRWCNEVNTLRSVTGAVCDSVGGCIYNVKK
jgi:anhydro-N-acetylmuramic acid kinase